MKDFASLAEENWRIKVDAEDGTATVVRPDPDPGYKGCFIGPLATVPVGMTTTDDDGKEALDLTAADGRNLFAIAMLPQFAGLVLWTEMMLGQLNGIHFDSTTEAGKFHRELRVRCKWLKELINNRLSLATSTEDYSSIIVPTFATKQE